MKQNQEDIPIASNQERESVLEETKSRRHAHSKKPRERIGAGRNEKNKITVCEYQKTKKMQGMFVRGIQNWGRAAGMRVVDY